MSSCSTTATSSPSPPSRPAATSPAGAAPITITSNLPLCLLGPFPRGTRYAIPGLTGVLFRVTVGNMNSRTYTQVARAEASERTRDALLDAATEAFFSGTWGSLSLDAIASAAGTTKQTLLRHYGSKQGLFEA